MDAPNANPTPARAGLLAEILRNLRLAWRLIRDPRIATSLKLLIPGLAAAYVLSPIDLLPDVLPVLGQLDDLALIAIAVTLFIEMCPAAIVREHREYLARGAAPAPKAATGQSRDGQVIDGEYRVIE
jgi:uncharacterized membrane protein YkvA (DUF1232 family)